MIEVSPESRGNILIVSARDRLTDSDYREVLIPRLEVIIREYGKARLLMDMGTEFHGWEAMAAWDDASFGIAHRNDFEKMAVVGAPHWVEWGLKIAIIAMSGEIRSFNAGEREEALLWIES